MRLKDELSAVGAIYVLIIFSFLWLSNHQKQEIKILELENKYIQAKHLVIDLHKENKNLISLKEENEDLKDTLKYVNKLQRIYDEIKDYSVEDQALGLSLSWTESSWNYKIVHPDPKDKGVCGVRTHIWGSYLKEIDTNYNSVSACIEIYNYYLNRTNNEFKAMARYKGAIENFSTTNKALDLKDKIYNILKEDK